MNEPTNADLYSVLLDIKEDIGGLKTSAGLQLEGLKNHGERIVKLENGAARQKGFMTALGALATVGGSAVGYLIEKFGFGHG